MPESTDESEVGYDDVEPEPRFPGGGSMWGPAADAADANKHWTVQSKHAMPKPQDDSPITYFHPSELPDPDVAREAGLIPLVNRADLVTTDPATETMPPSGNYAVDHPTREANRRTKSPYTGLSRHDDAYTKAKALTEVHVEDAPTDVPADDAPAEPDVVTVT